MAAPGVGSRPRGAAPGARGGTAGPRPRRSVTSGTPPVAVSGVPDGAQSRSASGVRTSARVLAGRRAGGDWRCRKPQTLKLQVSDDTEGRCAQYKISNLIWGNRTATGVPAPEPRPRRAAAGRGYRPSDSEQA